MILIDFSNFCIRTLIGNLDPRTDSDENKSVNQARFVILNEILTVKEKFSGEFGHELVFAVDAKRSPCWRKDYNPYYKSKRSKQREESKIDFNFILKCMGTIQEELRENFSYRMIEVQRAEADDIIATITKYVSANRKVRTGVIESSEPILILSADRDFFQLHRYDGVQQYSLKDRKMLTLESANESVNALLTKIIRGDSGDGITNILSDIDCFENGVRQKTVYDKKLVQPILESKSLSILTPEQKERFKLNRLLIDFDYIPESIGNEIISSYLGYEVKGNKSKILNYLIQNKLGRLIDRVSDF